MADSSFVPPLVYAVFGSSKHLAVGTVAACSLLISETIGAVASPEEEPTLYLHLVFTATFVTGVMQAVLGFLRYHPTGQIVKITLKSVLPKITHENIRLLLIVVLLTF